MPSPAEIAAIDTAVLPEIQQSVKLALSVIGAMHQIPKRLELRIVQNKKRRESGSYDPRLLQISVSRYAPDALATFIHEFGHFVDNRLLHPMSLEYASRYDLDIAPFMARCLDSSPLLTLLHVRDERRRFLSAADVAFVRESIEPHEIFARAYAQWICTRSDDGNVRESMKRRIFGYEVLAGRNCYLQWDPAEFVDIMGALEALLHRKGLI